VRRTSGSPTGSRTTVVESVPWNRTPRPRLGAPAV